MTSKLPLAALSFAAAISLAACNSEPEVVTLNKYDPQAEALAKAKPVDPPPMIQASKAYRCKDNSLIYVDFYTNDTAAVRAERGTPPDALLKAEGGSPPYVADGYSVSGSGDHITYSAPGKASQSCRT